MRVLLPLVLTAVTVFALASRARGEDPSVTDPALVEARLDLLSREVAYLRVREARLTTYVVKNGARAEELQRLVHELREGGFAAAANPSPTRERLLQGLFALAHGLKSDLPTLTDSELAMLANLKR